MTKRERRLEDSSEDDWKDGGWKKRGKRQPGIAKVSRGIRPAGVPWSPLFKCSFANVERGRVASTEYYVRLEPDEIRVNKFHASKIRQWKVDWLIASSKPTNQLTRVEVARLRVVWNSTFHPPLLPSLSLSSNLSQRNCTSYEYEAIASGKRHCSNWTAVDLVELSYARVIVTPAVLNSRPNQPTVYDNRESCRITPTRRLGRFRFLSSRTMLVIGDAASVPKMEDSDEYCNTEEHLGVSILSVRHIHSRFVISWKGLRELVTTRWNSVYNRANLVSIVSKMIPLGKIREREETRGAVYVRERFDSKGNNVDRVSTCFPLKLSLQANRLYRSLLPPENSFAGRRSKLPPTRFRTRCILFRDRPVTIRIPCAFVRLSSFNLSLSSNGDNSTTGRISYRTSNPPKRLVVPAESLFQIPIRHNNLNAVRDIRFLGMSRPLTPRMLDETTLWPNYSA